MLSQAGGHFGFSGNYARDRDEFRPRGAIPFNLDPDSDDDSSVVSSSNSITVYKGIRL